jgi:hypothetical protein
MRTPAGRRTSCAWITAPNAIGRAILRCFKLDFFGEALQISEKIFEMYPDGCLVWPAIPFQRELRQPSKAMSWRALRATIGITSDLTLPDLRSLDDLPLLDHTLREILRLQTAPPRPS